LPAPVKYSHLWDLHNNPDCKLPKISQILANKFPFAATPGQQVLFNLFDPFLESQVHRPTILIKGYAGTGKTTVISTLCEVLPLFNYQFVLLAPTGRAAKVMANYSGKSASTIHKKIYKKIADPDAPTLAFKRVKNYHKKTVFIIDEASMLGDDPSQTNRLLSDLIQFVFQHDDNRLLLVGDSAQLPPVGKYDSPALDADYLQHQYNLHIWSTELREVMRQEEASGILENATNLRDKLLANDTSFKLSTHKFKDIYKVTSDKLEDGLRYAYDKFGIENATILCRSNWQAVQYNQLIRRTILYYDEEIEAGDLLMVVKNNYFYLEPSDPAGFIANGDFVEVRKIIDFEECYGFRFATLQLQLVDYPDSLPFEAKVILDTLYSKSPSMGAEENQKLYGQIAQKYQAKRGKKGFKLALQQDEYLNALQVKFAYALTCHKSQGGQWKLVFVDQGLRGDFEVDTGFLRWLYTAMTRASDELYLINFDRRFFNP